MTDVQNITGVSTYDSILSAYTENISGLSSEELDQLVAQKKEWWNEFCQMQIVVYRQTYPNDTTTTDADIIASINSNPSYYSPLFAKLVQSKYTALVTGTSSSPEEEAKRKIMTAVFEASATLLNTLQDTIATLGPIMELNMEWQRAYANLAAKAPIQTGVAVAGSLPSTSSGTLDLSRATFGFGNITASDIAQYMKTASTSFVIPVLDTTGNQLTTTNICNPMRFYGGNNNVWGALENDHSTTFVNTFYFTFDPVSKSIQLKMDSSVQPDPWAAAQTWTTTITSVTVTNNNWEGAMNTLFNTFTSSTGNFTNLTADNGNYAGAVRVVYNSQKQCLDISVNNARPFADNYKETAGIWYFYPGSASSASALVTYPPLIANQPPVGTGLAWGPIVYTWGVSTPTVFNGAPGVLTPNVPAAGADSTTLSKLQEARSDANTQLQQYTTLLASRQQALHDRIQGLQANMNQAQEVYNQQTTLLSNIIQNLQTIVSTICR